MEKRSLIIGSLILVVTWLAFAEWQRREFVRQQSLLKRSLEDQGESIMLALASVFESHRWFAPFLQDQLVATLTDIAKSPSVLTIVITRQGEAIKSKSTRDDQVRDFTVLCSAGVSESIDHSLTSGGYWDATGFTIVHPFELSTSPPHSRMGRLGAGRRWTQETDDLEQFKAILVMDRATMDTQIGQERRNRVALVSLGGLLLIFTGIAWHSTVRLARARGTTQVLQAETRHLRELGQAAAGLAHETRNPLGLIRGWTQRLVAAGLPDDDQQQEAEAALEECDRVTARINQFLAFARPPTLTLENVRVLELVQQLHVLLEPDLDGRSIRIDSDDLSADATVLADREQFRQTLFNLIQNAIQFSPDDRTIRIGLEPQHRSYRLEIADEGPGPPPDAIDSLFEPYITSRPGGTGLGLAIVQRIATAHGWNAGYSPRADVGSVFWLDGMQPGKVEEVEKQIGNAQKDNSGRR